MADSAIITANVAPGTTVTSGVTSGSTVSSTVSTTSTNTANVVAGGVGPAGAAGAAGADGQGVPVGGTTGQVLSKNSNTDYDTEWSTVSGTGDVVGPASATDNAIVRYDSTTGKLLQDSVVTIADTSGNMAGVGTLNTHTLPGGTDTLVGRTTTDTLTNKTLTSPKIDAFKDTNGVKIVEYTANASGVNYLTQRAGSTGQAVLLSAESVTDTDVYLNLQSQGAGTVRANGVDVATISGTQTLTNKTLTSPVINTPTGIAKGDVGLGNVDNTSDATKNAATATLTNKTLTSPAITTPTGIVKGDVGLGNVDNTSNATERAATATLTNKRITKRIGTATSSATPTPDADAHDVYTVTALAVGATFGAPTGTPTEGQSLVIRVKDNGTARSLAYNAIYRAVGVTLPTTTVISKTIYLGMFYNSSDTKWDVVAVAQEA